jgi:hypothetical protein
MTKLRGEKVQFQNVRGVISPLSPEKVAPLLYVTVADGIARDEKLRRIMSEATHRAKWCWQCDT